MLKVFPKNIGGKILIPPRGQTFPGPPPTTTFVPPWDKQAPGENILNQSESKQNANDASDKIRNAFIPNTLLCAVRLSAVSAADCHF